MSKKIRADVHGSEADHRRHIQRQSDALERRLARSDGRLGVSGSRAAGRLPEIDAQPDLLKRPESTRFRRVGQVAPKFADVLGLAKDQIDAFTVDARWRPVQVLKTYLAGLLLPGESVWVEVERDARTSSRFRSIRISSASEPAIRAPVGKTDAIADLLSSAEGTRAHLADPPSGFRMEGVAPVVDRCTFENPGGKSLRATRSRDEYRRLEGALMALFGEDDGH